MFSGPQNNVVYTKNKKVLIESENIASLNHISLDIMFMKLISRLFSTHNSGDHFKYKI